MKNVRTTLLAASMLALALPVAGQQVPWSPMNRSSDNMEVLGHLPLGAQLSVADMDLEQEMDRPYAYISRMVYGWEGPKGTDIISLEAQLARPDFFTSDPDGFNAAADRLAAARAAKDEKELRWLDAAEKAEALDAEKS